MAEQHQDKRPIDPQIAVLSDILEWSKDRPGWIREAIRMLITQATVSEEDITRLVHICKAEAGIQADPVETAFFSKEHIVARQGSSVDVALLGISEIQGVNALADNASLSFAPEGMNLIYGGNGSGKSSYTRILKNSCRCAAPTAIQPNVFALPEDKQAKIAFRAGGADAAFMWTEGAACSEPLNSIRVFDSRCADVYVNDEREASFVPYGIGVLSMLAEGISPRVKEVLLREQSKLQTELPDLAGVLPDKKALQWYNSLTAETRTKDVDAWTQFTPQNEDELTRLSAALSVADPQRRIIALRAYIDRVRQLIGMVSKIELWFSSDAIKKLTGLVNDRDTKRQAATIAVAAVFDGTLPGTGSPVWRQLWESARGFVQSVAYPGADFPNTERCPLCQQELEGEPLGLMNRFEEFIKGDVEIQAQAAEKALNDYWSALFQVSLNLSTHSPLLKELGEDIAKKVESFVQSAVDIREGLEETVKANSWDRMTVLAESPSEVLGKEVSRVELDIEALSKRADPEQRVAFQQRFDNLSSRKVLHSHKGAISTQIKNLLSAALYDEALSKCRSGTISTKAGGLAETYVTPELQNVFEARLSQLFGGREFVVLEKTRTAQGVPYFRLKLDGAVQDKPINEVASEGEFRAIALASFLAEIDLAPDKSGVVFDDPVSSFDHRFREKFAKIVREIAFNRQVIVFTHDLFFLSRFTHWVNLLKPKQIPTCSELWSIAGRHGYSRSGVPMEVKPFSARKKHIISEIEAAKRVAGTDPDGYLRIAYSLASELRIATEGVVEEVLLNGTVRRFDPAVRTRQLEPVLTTISDQDLSFFVDLMDRYSKYPHDQAPERRPEPPDVGEVEKDINALSDWVSGYKKRAKS